MNRMFDFRWSVPRAGGVSSRLGFALVLTTAILGWAETPSLQTRTIKVDGQFSDWKGIDPVASDKAEDAHPCDWRSLHVAHDAHHVYFRYETREKVNFDKAAAYNIFLDTDRKRSTGFRGAGDEFPIGADHLVQGGTFYAYKGSGVDWSWEAIGELPYAITGNEIELSVDRTKIGKAAPGIDLFLYGDNQTEGIGGNHLDVCPDDALKAGGGGGKLQHKW